MKQMKSCKYALISVALFAMAVFNISSQVWYTFWIAETSWQVGAVYTVLSAWGFPLLIAGFGMVYLADKPDYSAKYVYTRQLPVALIGCIVWWVVLALLYMRYNCPNEMDTDTFFECMSKVLETPYNGKFLQLMVAFFSFYPLLKRIANDRKMVRYAVIIFYVFVAVFPGLTQIPYVKYLTLFTSQINWGFYTSFGLYLFLGVWLTQTEFKWHQRIVIYCLGVLATVAMYACTVFLSAKNIGYEHRFVADTSPFTAMQVMALIVAVQRLFRIEKLRDGNHGLIRGIAVSAYGFIPAFVIGQEFAKQLISGESMPLALEIPVKAIICFAAAFVLAKCMTRIQILSSFTVCQEGRSTL